MDGAWDAVRGTGTATGTDGTYTLTMTGSTNMAGLNFLSETNSNSARFIAVAYSEWTARRTDGYTDAVVLDYRGGAELTLTRVSDNKFKYDFPSGRSSIELTVNSDKKTGKIKEAGVFIVTNSSGTFTYNYSATYDVE